MPLIFKNRTMFENIFMTVYGGQIFVSVIDIKERIDKLIVSGNLTDNEILLLVKISKELNKSNIQGIEKLLNPLPPQ